jgi:Gas vesicle synthesis protein GvpL/GvpF
MSLYLYCLSDELGEAGLAGVRGLDEEPARLFTHEGLAAVVSRFDEAPAAVTREHVLAHNRVNSQVLAAVTPLPFRFGTLTDEPRLAAYLRERGPDLRAALARVRGCVEMSVKLMEKSGVRSRESEVESEAGVADFGAAGAGTAFLLKKRREMLGEEGARRRAEEEAAWLASGVCELARETAARLSPSEAIIVRAAHLVERARVDEYRARLRALAAERRDLRLLTSGPWPPYSFSDIKQ